MHDILFHFRFFDIPQKYHSNYVISSLNSMVSLVLTKGYLGKLQSSSFTPDITPIILAAHRDNYVILKMLLDRGDRIPRPHDLRCACHICSQARREDGLQHSKLRINTYRALTSPSFIILTSNDPILTAFEMSAELQQMGELENEFRVSFPVRTSRSRWRTPHEGFRSPQDYDI